MKHRGKNLALLLIGILIGCALSGPAVNAATEYFQAIRSSHPVYVDGERVELEAYLINGNNYVKLRDIGRAVNFNVYWDGHAAQIESGSPYTGVAPEKDEAGPEPESTAGPEAAEALTEAVNPSVLNGTYTREAYEALRSTVTTGKESAAVAMSEETRKAMQSAASVIGSWPGYAMKTAADGKTTFSAKYPGSYSEAAAYCQPLIDGLSGTDRERVRELAFFVCDRLTYDSSEYATPRTALTDAAVHPSACMGYAHCFKFLCDLADIPCILVHSDTHQWNEVYVDGRWQSVDVTGTDAGDNVSYREKIPVLHDPADMQGSDYVQIQPELTRFAKELLIPGSTR